MDGYPSRSFYITFPKFGRADVNLPKHQKVGKVADASIGIVHVKNERFSYLWPACE